MADDVDDELHRLRALVQRQQEQIDHAAELLADGHELLQRAGELSTAHEQLLREQMQLLAESETQRDALVTALEPLGHVYWHSELESWVLDVPMGGCLHLRDVLQQSSAARLDPERCAHSWQTRCTVCGVVAS